MRLVLDPEWEVCYIEVSREEAETLGMGQHYPNPSELRLLTSAYLRGAPLPPWLQPSSPEVKELESRAIELADIARPFARRFTANRRAPYEGPRLLDIEARVVA